MALKVLWKGNYYFLHEHPNVKQGKLYFFSKNQEGAVDLPAEYEVTFGPKSGFPFVRKGLRQLNMNQGGIRLNG